MVIHCVIACEVVQDTILEHVHHFSSTNNRDMHLKNWCTLFYMCGILNGEQHSQTHGFKLDFSHICCNTVLL